MTNFSSDTFEHDYILQVLQHMVQDLTTEKPIAQILDHYAVELTAFMNGQIRAVVRQALSLTQYPREPVVPNPIPYAERD